MITLLPRIKSGRGAAVILRRSRQSLVLKRSVLWLSERAGIFDINHRVIDRLRSRGYQRNPIRRFETVPYTARNNYHRSGAECE
jgi:hypothetical protein